MIRLNRRRISCQNNATTKGTASPNSRLLIATSRSGGGGAVSPASSRGTGGAASSQQYLETGDVTPGCTDYTPRAEQLLKQVPTFAAPRAKRFFPQQSSLRLPIRPHVYEDPDSRTFRRSNSGSFSRAKRFGSSTPLLHQTNLDAN